MYKSLYPSKPYYAQCNIYRRGAPSKPERWKWCDFQLALYSFSKLSRPNAQRDCCYKPHPLDIMRITVDIKGEKGAVATITKGGTYENWYIKLSIPSLQFIAKWTCKNGDFPWWDCARGIQHILKPIIKIDRKK